MKISKKDKVMTGLVIILGLACIRFIIWSPNKLNHLIMGLLFIFTMYVLALIRGEN